VRLRGVLWRRKSRIQEVAAERGSILTARESQDNYAPRRDLTLHRDESCFRSFLPLRLDGKCRRRRMERGGCQATMDELDISGMLDLRREQQQRISRDESVEERLDRFIKLQTASFELLRSSPEGYRNFLRRNHKSRRVEVIDGVWRPVSVDRPTPEA